MNGNDPAGWSYPFRCRNAGAAHPTANIQDRHAWRKGHPIDGAPAEPIPKGKWRKIIAIRRSIVSFFQLDLRRNWLSHQLTSYLCASEADAETEDLLLFGENLPALQIDMHRHTNSSDIHRYMEPALREHVD